MWTLQLNWSLMAESILRNYTREVYLATKNAGWDGQLSHLNELSHLNDVIEEQRVVTSQWDMASSVLFSITVITTIGRRTTRTRLRHTSLMPPRYEYYNK